MGCGLRTPSLRGPHGHPGARPPGRPPSLPPPEQLPCWYVDRQHVCVKGMRTRGRPSLVPAGGSAQMTGSVGGSPARFAAHGIGSRPFPSAAANEAARAREIGPGCGSKPSPGRSATAPSPREGTSRRRITATPRRGGPSRPSTPSASRRAIAWRRRSSPPAGSSRGGSAAVIPPRFRARRQDGRPSLPPPEQMTTVESEHPLSALAPPPRRIRRFVGRLLVERRIRTRMEHPDRRS